MRFEVVSLNGAKDLSGAMQNEESTSNWNRNANGPSAALLPQPNGPFQRLTM
jgi:hypothetical protein